MAGVLPMDKWEKVVLLHRALKSCKYCIPLKTIMAELECSEATFHRIRGFMQTNLGAPIFFDRIYGGYCYDEAQSGQFELPGLWFTRNEIEAILSLDYAVESLQGGFFRDILAPVKSRFEPVLAAQKTRINTLRDRIKIIPIQSRPIGDALFRAVAGAVVRQRCLYIEHSKLSEKEPTSRTISPQTLVRYRDNWYVDAYCHLRKKLRTFALDRLTRAEPVTNKFHVVSKREREEFFASAYGIFTGPATKSAVIDFTGTAAREVAHEQWHPKQVGKWLDDKTFRLTVPYGYSRELIMDILRWGEWAEVKQPRELRQEVGITIKRAMKNYEK
jgi:predicted DNA-binding transcriptional regulator YafY